MCLPESVDSLYINIMIDVKIDHETPGALSRSSIVGETAKGRLRWSRKDQELYVCLVSYLSSREMNSSHAITLFVDLVTFLLH